MTDKHVNQETTSASAPAHSHSHGHSHGHGHHHHHPAPPSNFNLAFAVAVFGNLAFTVIEAIYALLANSTSLLADAGHNLGDVFSLLLAWGASWLLTRPPSERYSYGFKRTSILAALINSLVLLMTSLGIAYEAIHKLVHPSTINEVTVIIVALLGIIINGVTALLFMRGRNDDLNIKAAFLHLAYDALISFGVVLAGLVIFFTGWHILDPIVGLLIVITILAGTWGLLRDSVNLILDAVPHHVDANAVKGYLQSINGVTTVHELHIWALSTNEVALTAHLVMPTQRPNDTEIRAINEALKGQFQVDHATLQIESGELDGTCASGENCCDETSD